MGTIKDNMYLYVGSLSLKNVLRSVPERYDRRAGTMLLVKSIRDVILCSALLRGHSDGKTHVMSGTQGSMILEDCRRSRPRQPCTHRTAQQMVSAETAVFIFGTDAEELC